MIALPPRFKERMKNLLGDKYGEFLASYEKPARKAIRVNTLKISAQDFAKIAPFPLTGAVPWESNGFTVAEEKAGKTVHHAAGLYYVQEPSAMCAAPMLDVREGERVLDLCAAPGGKGTQLAQAMNGKGILVLNEINFSRAKILSQNVERLGVENAIVTCAPPEAIASSFGGYFDKVLVDAPCSGEGMFKKEPNAVPEWSLENVALCAARQKQVLDCAGRALAVGGKMVYSTCTFAPEEDERQAEDFLARHSAFRLTESKKLYPHECEGEGHFAALFEKTDGEREDMPLLTPQCRDKKLLALYREFEKSYLYRRFDRLHLVGNTLFSLPENCPKIPLQMLRVGVRLGEFKNGRFEPDHSLAMVLTAADAQCVEADEETALSYLGGNPVACPETLRGWATVAFHGYPLGWCKAVDGTAKNHLPKGLRI